MWFELLAEIKLKMERMVLLFMKDDGMLLL